MKRKISMILIAGSVILFTNLQCTTKSYIGRWIFWNSSDIEDYMKFPNHPFQASNDPFFFENSIDFSYDTLLVSEKKSIKSTLRYVLEKTHTTAFLIIRNDSVLYEKYLSGYDRHSINTSFSTAKSITSLLLGLAIEDGLIASENDKVTNYLPELLHVDTNYSLLRISHLLDMFSGIQFKDHDLPWGDKPKAYYHPRLRERVMELPLTFLPGEAFQYNSYNPIILGLIIERTTGVSPAEYFENKIWNQLGMEYDGSWSMDSEYSKTIKMESGLNLRAIDFAKLGRLVLNYGDWNGQQIVSESWLKNSFSILPEHNLKTYSDEIYYENFWWLYSKDKQNPYIISGWGHLGQFLYVFPEKQLIIVRMGKKTGKVDSWGRIFMEIAGY
jgi:CubicO group peptidase (beta-lactamase class C family)